jgi:thiol-disulfide isomerase/thioredoxin
MGKAERNRRQSAREKIAAQQAAARRAQVRKQVLLTVGSVAAVLAVVVAFVVIKAFAGPASAGSNTATANASVVANLTSVPASTLKAVGKGSALTYNAKPLIPITGPALTENGKPEVLYIGAEYCPYCAAERWAVIVALARFGTFSGLAPIRSAAKDGGGNAEPYPLTPTWTFAKASYTSSYLTFTPVEGYTNIPDKATGFYTVLQTPTAAQQALLDKYDAAYQGAIPFIDYGNKFLSVGASYNPAGLSGLTWAQIAADLHDPTSAVAKSVLGTANFATAAICSLTNNQPASACTSTVRALQAKI